MPLPELKCEYRSCGVDDEVKKLILKKIIRQKIEKQNEYMHFKKRNENIAFDNLIALKNKNNPKQTIYQKRGEMEKCWESHKKDSTVDPRFKDELESDFTNNKLMERLNVELDFRLNGKNEKVFDKPYADNDYGDYVPVKDFDKFAVTRHSFSSTRGKHPL